MKINLKKVIGIMVLIIAFEVVYLIGFYMPNKVVYGNSEDEIAEEIPICESELESEIENLISESEIAEEDLTEIPNDDIIIIEDILDSGKTLYYIRDILSARKPNSIKICTLFDKPERREADIKADYIGSLVPNEFIVGYGLDYAEYYRNLPFIGVLKESVYENNN